MTKVVKVYLISAVTDKAGNAVDYKAVNRILWDLQKETQCVKNKAVQLCWEWFTFQSDYKEKYGTYPKDKDILHCTLSSYVYDRLKGLNSLQSGNLITSIIDVCKHFKKNRFDYLKGTKAIANYKADPPLDLHNKSISLSYTDDDFVFTLSIFKEAAKQKSGIDRFTFKALVKDKSTQTILERCIDGIYKISASQLIYDRTKKMWKLNLSYSFTPETVKTLDPDIVLGVDLGVAKPIVASVYGDKARFIIDGNEIIAFRNRVEQRKKALGRQTKYCGDGRVGHGIKKRTEHVNKVADKVARFRDTTNFRYAKALIDYALKNNCGTIQMEDLSGISSDDAFLKQWSYFDLQQKITNKAAEYGIAVVKINPEYTSQRCSKCGFIHKDNRSTQRKFECLQCGFKENADYNASQNISIRDIDKIIEGAKVK